MGELPEPRMDGASCLVVKVLAQHVRDLGSCPSLIQLFSAHLVSDFTGVKRK